MRCAWARLVKQYDTTPPMLKTEQGASKRRRAERAAAPLSAHHAAEIERIARELEELAGAAPDVPQLAE